MQKVIPFVVCILFVAVSMSPLAAMTRRHVGKAPHAPITDAFRFRGTYGLMPPPSVAQSDYAYYSGSRGFSAPAGR